MLDLYMHVMWFPRFECYQFAHATSWLALCPVFLSQKNLCVHAHVVSLSLVCASRRCAAQDLTNPTRTQSYIQHHACNQWQRGQS